MINICFSLSKKKIIVGLGRTSYANEILKKKLKWMGEGWFYINSKNAPVSHVALKTYPRVEGASAYSYD